jgi:SET domain-containing protein
MKKLHSSDKIYVSNSTIPGAGRGVFARVAFKKGELIEECPVIELAEHDPSNHSEGTLITYFYYFGTTKERANLALGFGSLYNHTYEPNATYTENYKEKTMNFIALKDIKPEEEITVNYNQEQKKDRSPLWF